MAPAAVTTARIECGLSLSRPSRGVAASRHHCQRQQSKHGHGSPAPRPNAATPAQDHLQGTAPNQPLLLAHLVEAFFSIITRQALRRGNFPTVADLITAIGRFIAAWNDRCAPVTSTKDPDTVIVKATDPRHRKTQQTSDTEH